eukprot:8655914-Karenia_brevis.AAC.1
MLRTTPAEKNCPAQESANTHTCDGHNHDANIPPFTFDELEEALRATKNGKCKDSAGLVAEMLKHSGHNFKSV